MLSRLKKSKRWIIISIFALFWPGTVFSLVLEPIATFNQLTRLDDVIVVGEKVFFVTVQSESPGITTVPPALVVAGGDQTASMILAENLDDFFFRHIIESNGLIYFLQNSFELWVTDGTPANTRQVIDLEELVPGARFITGIQSNNGLLVVSLSGADFTISMVATDGTEEGTAVYEPDNADDFLLNSLCVINENNFIILDFWRRSFGQFSNGAIRKTDVLDPERYSLRLTNLASFPDGCIYSVFDSQNDSVEQLLKISVSGSQELITVPSIDGLPDARLLSTRLFQNRLIVSRAISDNPSTSGRQPAGDFFELQTGTATLLNTGIANFPGNEQAEILDIGFTADMGYLLIAGTQPPLFSSSATVVIRFDANYQFTDESFQVSGNSRDTRFNDFSLFSLNAEDYLYIPSAERLTAFTNFGESGNIRTSNIGLRALVSLPAQSNQAVYAIGIDRTTRNNNIYRVQETPSVSLNLEGLWGNPDIDSQGIQISTALGADRQTRFLFVSILANSQGQPLWLGGAAPIQAGQPDIELELRLSTGLSFLISDPAQMAQREIVGTATITVTGCDRIQLNLELTPPFESRGLELFRTVDQSFAGVCSDG